MKNIHMNIGSDLDRLPQERHGRIAYLCKVFESIYSWHGYMYLIILASIDTHYCWYYFSLIVINNLFTTLSLMFCSSLSMAFFKIYKRKRKNYSIRFAHFPGKFSTCKISYETPTEPVWHFYIYYIKVSGMPSGSKLLK